MLALLNKIRCPFCKTANYAVEYRGVKTKEEKGLEQIELQDDKERTQKRSEVSSSRLSIAPGELECGPAAVPSDRAPVESEDIVSPQYSIRHPSALWRNRYIASLVSFPIKFLIQRLKYLVKESNGVPVVMEDDEFDLDLEDIMLMEAIWLSIQENGRQKNPLCGDAAPSEQFIMEARHASPAKAPLAGSSSPSGGLACAIAALAERQQMGGESLVHNNVNMPSFNMLPSARMMGTGSADRGSDAAEAGTSYASSETAEDAGGISALLPPPPPDEIGGSFQNVYGPIESFEEQMMLATAISLAEARAMTSEPQSAWQ
ncbi:hypothetical protein H0E87_020794 [Populus deltoides]|uniref:Uncharacterized protein n=1 Tax=Populus deltoides TaxID=3696 RepID=A0A8T2XP13_POPDE|nr:hypothetical protein H0E87_020794 [Populus deltoides]